MELYERWREIEQNETKRPIKRRIKKETNVPAAKKNKPTPPKASNPLPSSIPQFPPPEKKNRNKSQKSSGAAAGSDTKLNFFQKQAKGKQQCLIHAVNNVLGANVFVLAHFKAASKKAGKERT
ncbi:hypothetical protein ScalyP_jg4578 [Parmales sp. scaly parma]|nr:hypothetical protein ScalyP_jg4578 [Parmales sp. scaly parma]